jgi:hypothetical protein
MVAGTNAVAASLLLCKGLVDCCRYFSSNKALGLNWTLAEAETWLKENEDSIVLLTEDVGNVHILNLLNKEKVQQ